MAIRWWSERPKTSASALPPLPANARAAEFLPDAELLPKVAVYVTTGGYGGLHYAMENGVPIVVAGDTEDKPEGAARGGMGRRWHQPQDGPPETGGNPRRRARKSSATAATGPRASASERRLPLPLAWTGSSMSLKPCCTRPIGG